MKAFWIAALATAFLTLGSEVVFAQPGASREVVAHIEGTVLLDGLRLEPSSSPFPFNENSVVLTENGRVQIMFASGDTLFLGADSSMRLSNNHGLNYRRFEMLTGSAVLITGDFGPVVVCEEEVQLSDSGVFRFDVHTAGGDRFCRVRVFNGAAAAQMPSFILVLTNGKTSELNRHCGDRIQRNEFHIEDMDDLDRWSRQRTASDARQR